MSNTLGPLTCFTCVRSVCLFLLLLTMGASHAGERLNVLFIMADDLNCELGCYGSGVVKSPNLDRIAARGVRFDRAYCNYPVCNASRTSLLSGRRPDSTGVVDNVTPPRATLGRAVFLPELYRTSGYVTMKVGKVFHTGEAFEDPRSWDVDIREESTAKRPPQKQIVSQAGADESHSAGIVLRAKDEETWDGYVARQAAKFLEQAARGGKPFFVAAGFRRPHTPYIAPEKYFALYDPAKLQPRPGPPDHLANIPRLALTYRLGDPALPAKEAPRVMAAYYASVSFMDAQVGVLLDALERLKLWDKTVVVFLSDHGYHLGEHGGLWHKMTLFEEAARAPLIVAAPGTNSGAASPRLVEFVDVYPTLVELCGLARPKGLEGQSFVPLLKEPRLPWKQLAPTVVSRGDNIRATMKLDPAKMGRTIRTERWRYTLWHDGTAELYDHERDTFEYRNLANDRQHATTVDGLKRLLRQ